MRRNHININNWKCSDRTKNPTWWNSLEKYRSLSLLAIFLLLLTFKRKHRLKCARLPLGCFSKCSFRESWHQNIRHQNVYISVVIPRLLWSGQHIAEIRNFLKIFTSVVFHLCWIATGKTEELSSASWNKRKWPVIKAIVIRNQLQWSRHLVRMDDTLLLK